MRAIFPCVSAVVRNENGEVLVTRRSEKVWAPGKWCLPGGHLDGGQDWVTAMKAELSEETGLIATTYRLLGVYSDPNFHFIDDFEGNRRFFLVAAFLVDSVTGEVKPNEEVSDYGWYSLSNLPEPLLPSERIKIEDAFKYQGRSFVR